MLIKSHRDLEVYKLAFSAAMQIADITLGFPKVEMYSMTDQIKRSSRSVCANIAEAFRKRKYTKHFISKLSDSEAEAAETQTWLEFALAHKYISETVFEKLDDQYDHILSMIVKMQNSAGSWQV